MKRGTALLLAMATLLAHALAIHLDENGRFGTPYESVHVAYHLARNLVREGQLAWNIGLADGLRGGLGSYASPLWVGIAALAEMRWISVALFTQMVGMAAAFITVAVSTHFSTDRAAGVIPALLLVSSGSFAAAAASGTEYPLAALLFCTAFVALERRKPWSMAISLAALAATRPEAILIVAGFLALVLTERVVARGAGGRPMSPWAILPAVLVLAGLLGREASDVQRPYTEFLAALPRAGGDRATTGLLYLRDFAQSSVLPLLLIFPVLAALLGRAHGAGLRAMVLGLLWMFAVVVEGGGPQSFSIGFVPCLPVLAIAVQQGVLAALDSRRPFTEGLSWTLLTVGLVAAVMTSKFPGDLGPLPTGALHERWMAGSSQPPYGRDPLLGRASLQQEMRVAREMRDLASFLRDNVTGARTILTPYPGVLGYLSGMQVFDLFGRVVTAPGATPRPAWDLRGNIDLAANLALKPDFIHPGLLYSLRNEENGIVRGLDADLARLDPAPPAESALVADYELVTLPVRRGYGRNRGAMRPTLLLRRRTLGMTPVLDLSILGDSLLIDVRLGSGEGHSQLVRLAVQAIDAQGTAYRMDPSGQLTSEKRTFARTGLNLRPNARGSTRLLEFRMPREHAGIPIVEIRAQLMNPGVRETHPLAPASAQATVGI